MLISKQPPDLITDVNSILLRWYSLVILCSSSNAPIFLAWKGKAWGIFVNSQTNYLHLPFVLFTVHYGDVIMSTMASQITGISVIYSTVCSGVGQKKSSKLSVTGLCEGNSPVTGEFPAQRDSNAENASIRWRYHELWLSLYSDVINNDQTSSLFCTCQESCAVVTWANLWPD